MPRVLQTWRYDALFNGAHIGQAVAVVLQRAAITRWQVFADGVPITDQEVAHELFPRIEGTYTSHIPERFWPLPFALKPEDSVDED